MKTEYVGPDGKTIIVDRQPYISVGYGIDLDTVAPFAKCPDRCYLRRPAQVTIDGFNEYEVVVNKKCTWARCVHCDGRPK